MTKPLHIEGLDELAARVKTLQEFKKFKAGLRSLGLTIKGWLSLYPPQKHLTRTEVYGQPFQSDKQRRYFFYALHAGIIQVPYSRGSSPQSERFKASWAMSVQNSGLTIRIGNDTTYGPYLMDPDQQSKFMDALGWPTVDEVMETHSGDISEFLAYVIRKE